MVRQSYYGCCAALGAAEEKQVPRLRLAIEKANRKAALGMTELYDRAL
jgi:hypothetical protein